MERVDGRMNRCTVNRSTDIQMNRCTVEQMVIGQMNGQTEVLFIIQDIVRVEAADQNVKKKQEKNFQCELLDFKLLITHMRRKSKKCDQCDSLEELTIYMFKKF